MKHIIGLTNGEVVELSSLADVKQWLGENNYVVEDNARLWGIDETITSQGDVCIYEKGNESDRIDGRIRRA